MKKNICSSLSPSLTLVSLKEKKVDMNSVHLFKEEFQRLLSSFVGVSGISAEVQSIQTVYYLNHMQIVIRSTADCRTYVRVVNVTVYVCTFYLCFVEIMN